jgi:hypothetical protein
MKNAHRSVLDFCPHCLAEGTVSPHFAMLDKNDLVIGHATLATKQAELLMSSLQMIACGRKPRGFSTNCLPHEASQGNLLLRRASRLELRNCDEGLCAGARFIFSDKKGRFAEAHPGKIDWIIGELQRKFSADSIGDTMGTA